MNRIFVAIIIFNALLFSTMGYGDDSRVDGTGGLIGYLTQLVEQQVIGKPELQNFLENLKNKKRYNPISEFQVNTNSASLVRYDVIQRYLDETKLNRKKLYLWAIAQLKKRDDIKKVKAKTIDPHIPLKFYPIPPGTFEMGENQEKHTVTLTHEIKMMSTLVTQWMWSKIMGENPSHFKTGDFRIEKFVNGKTVQMQPDHPVESVTWWSAIYFANELSKRKNLEPAYDWSAITEWEGTPQGGDWRPKNDNDASKLMINAPEGNIYLTQGYRLPTEAEQEYFRSLLGEFEPKDHAWTSEISEEKTHAVGQKKSLVIDGKHFYDLIGNVWEWGNDWFGKYIIDSVSDPAGPNNGEYKVIRGGSWSYDARGVRVANRSYGSPGLRGYNVGFRLLRTIR